MEVIGHWIIDSSWYGLKNKLWWSNIKLVSNEHGHEELDHKQSEGSYNKQLMCWRMFNK